MQCGNQAGEKAYSEGGWCKPSAGALPAISKRPGTTGTGAPVTERLRCRVSRQLGWYRVHSLAPKQGAGFIFFLQAGCGLPAACGGRSEFDYNMEVLSNEPQILRRQ